MLFGGGSEYRYPWGLKTLNYSARFIELASEINGSMPEVVVRKAGEILAQHRPPALSAGVEAELERIVRRYQGPDFHFEA